MSRTLATTAPEAKAAIAALFDRKPPVLVEVGFPRMGTSPDWYLLEDEEEFEQILERLAPGVEVRLVSVWDVNQVPGEVCLTKQ
jgi:hypothetical protein